jgi:hypothetical protein
VTPLNPKQAILWCVIPKRDRSRSMAAGGGALQQMILHNRYLLVLALANASCASAQPIKPFDPLGVPTGTVRCRPLPLPATAPPSSVGFQLEDGTLLINDRLISAVYDSLGVPRLLVVTATEQLAGGHPIMHVLSASFPTSEPAMGFQLVQPLGDDGTTESPREALSSAMIAESRDLAVWLWKHRCGGVK